MTKTCLDCNGELKTVKQSVVESAGFYIAFEVSVWLVAVIIASIFALCEITLAVLLSAMVIVIFVGYYVYQNYVIYICQKCSKRFGLNELRKQI